jgi:hypothetical protein
MKDNFPARPFPPRRGWSIPALAAAVVFGLPGTSTRAQPPSLRDIVDGLERQEKLLFENRSLLIRYELTKTADVTRTRFSGGLIFAEWILAYRGDKWFIERRYNEPATEALAGPMTQLLRDGLLLEWRSGSRSATLGHFDSGGNLYAGLCYTQNLSLDAPRYIAKAGGGDIASIRQIPSLADHVNLPFLPEFLRVHQSQYQVLPTPQEVDGAPCWVVSWPGMDRFWVDTRRGFAIPRRIYNWGPGKPVRYELRHSDYREVKPGLWLPFTQIEDKYASIIAERKELWGQVAARSEYRLRAVEFNRLPEGFFFVKLPEGTRVIDMVRHSQYTVTTTNSDPFFQAGGAEATIPPPSPASGWWLWPVGVGILAVLVAVVICRVRTGQV